MSFYVTTPIYYVNAAPHLGHAYTTIAADVLARHHRQRREPVFFLTGTDEHGEPVADAARALGIEPQALADGNSERFRALAPSLLATNDFFIRTTDPQHMAVVGQILSRVRDNGYVYDGIYEGWYCPRCADFKGEADIDPGNLCPIHHIALTREREQNYFFRLSSFQEPLERLYAERPEFVSPRSRYNEALAFVRSGLRDVPLSRHRLTWGVPVPWDPSHVFYVWFDALLNYYSALTYAPVVQDRGWEEETSIDSLAAEGPIAHRTLLEEFWPADVHLIGKDILRFHAVYWPALLMAAGLELPRRVVVHGFLLMEGEKMSKSLGNVLDPFEVIERFGVDALRFYLMRDVPFGQDGSISTVAFEQRYESELANELGNLAGRTLAMVHRYREGIAPAVELDRLLAADFESLPGEVVELMDRAELTQALDVIWQRVRRLNRYVEEQAPWQLAREQRAAELDRVLASLVAGLRVLAALLSAYLPAATETILDALRVDDRSLRAARWDSPQALGIPLDSIRPLFPKRDQAAGLSDRAPRPVIDSHTHLDLCEPPNAELVQRAVRAGVTRMLTVGLDGPSSRQALLAADSFPQVYASVGIHPTATGGFDDAALAELSGLAEHDRCVAIGETGVDLHRDPVALAHQQRSFAAHIQLARATGKPLVVHSRAADRETLDQLAREADGVAVLLHCFSMPERMEECLERGYMISFAGNVTYKNAGELAGAAGQVPPERLLIETDAPFLTPQAVRKERNQPAYVTYTFSFLAERREVSVAELEATVQRNAERLFGW